MSVVVMTREMGTLGKDVAREFARRRSYAVLHHEMVPDRRARTHESEVYRFLEGCPEAIEAWRSDRAPDGYLTPGEVLEIAQGGNVVIRGWGATRLLKTVPNVLSVRVCAPMERRIATMTQRLGTDARTARREIERNDAAHARSFLRFFEADWRDPQNFDLVLNTAHIDPMTCADVIEDATRNASFTETEAMRQVLSDMALEEKIKAKIRGNAALAGSGRHIEVSVDHASVRLYGLVRDCLSRSVAERLASETTGVRGLRNEIAQAGGWSD